VESAGSRYERAVRHVASLSSGPPVAPGLRVTLNFHPDRRFGTGLVLDALADEGTYRSQFVTATSNGGLTAHPGGDRSTTCSSRRSLSSPCFWPQSSSGCWHGAHAPSQPA